MAKKSMVARDVKRSELAAKYAEKRAELKKVIANPDVDFEEKQAAIFASFLATTANKPGDTSHPVAPLPITKAFGWLATSKPYQWQQPHIQRPANSRQA